MDGGYQRVKVIGKGAFGSAILVRKDAELFVRKEVPLNGLSAKDKQEAEHEAAVLKGLSHRNIIRYVDSGVSFGKLWIIMAYASGGDLDVYVQKKKRSRLRFELDEVMGIFAQCCLALNYLHGKKILHRDLKSKNIFLDKKLGKSNIPLVKSLRRGVFSPLLINTCVCISYCFSFFWFYFSLVSPLGSCSWATLALQKCCKILVTTQKRRSALHFICHPRFARTGHTRFVQMCGLWVLFCLKCWPCAFHLKHVTFGLWCKKL
eukprot:m.49299 g.49299  ORF g.49299 m.49299 type:complete len:262 (-) comp12466_c0_seq1:317-1102(-)